MSETGNKKKSKSAKAEASKAESQAETEENIDISKLENDQAVESEVEGQEVTSDGAELEPEPVVEISAEDALRQERDAFQEKWLRAVAELDNVRKRSRREVADTRRLSQVEVLRSFLDVLDNFDRAFEAYPVQGDETSENDKGLREGVDLIYQKFMGVLNDKGVKPIDVMGKEFDPQVHEAVGQLPREGVESGHVIEIIQKGFMFREMVLRPARVIISS